jgi:predicted CoA-binding protein
MFPNPPPAEIARRLRAARTIAIVGLSPDRTRPSHGVAKALRRFGYRIVPVNPFAESILGEPAVASLDQLPAARSTSRAGIFTVMDRCLFKERAALR